MKGMSNSSYLLLAMVALLLLPTTKAFVAPTLPPRTSSASSTQRFSSIAMNPAPRNIGDRVQELMEKNRENKLARRKSAGRASSSATSTDASASSLGGQHNLPNVYHAASKEDCMEIAENALNRLTVFKFYSSYCRACKRIAPRFDRLAKENPDVDFVFVQVSATNKKFVVKDLGIPALPYGGIYHPEVGMAETMSISSQRLVDFEAIVESYRDAECRLPEVDEEDALFAAPYQRISSATK